MKTNENRHHHQEYLPRFPSKDMHNKQAVSQLGPNFGEIFGDQNHIFSDSLIQIGGKNNNFIEPSRVDECLDGKKQDENECAAG